MDIGKIIAEHARALTLVPVVAGFIAFLLGRAGLDQLQAFRLAFYVCGGILIVSFLVFYFAALREQRRERKQRELAAKKAQIVELPDDVADGWASSCRTTSRRTRKNSPTPREHGKTRQKSGPNESTDLRLREGLHRSLDPAPGCGEPAQEMLTSVLPGLRELRAPLAGGYL